MGKVLKTIGKIVTIVGAAALTVVTGGAAAPVLIGAVAAFGPSALRAIAGRRSLEDTGANNRGTAFVDPNATGAYVFGETAAPVAVIFEENHGSNKSLVTNVAAHAWHRIDAYVSLHVEGELVNFSGDNATGDYAGSLRWFRKLGDGASQTAISLPGTQWPGTAKGAGVAHSAFEWNFKNSSKLTGGVPNNILVRVRGARLYDPRLDSTVGGSGSQRYDNPATWTYNAGNAALVALRYIIGERSADGRVIWGVGEAQTDVDLASFIAMANVADEVRDSAPRFRLDGVFPTSNNHEQFFREWEANTGGKITRIGGRRYIWLPHDDLTPVATITDDDVLSRQAVTLRVATPVEDLVNTARGRFIEPANLYQAGLYPDVEEASAIAEDGGLRVLDADFSWVQSVKQAERTARYLVRRSRFGRVFNFAVGWEGLLWPPFSIIELDLRETDGQPVLARITDKTLSAEGVTILTLEEEDASIYDDTVPLGTPPANETIVNRVSRFGTVTPRYIDGVPIDALKPADAGATRGGLGIGPPGVRWGEGATTIRIEENRLDDGTPNDGEIRFRAGFWKLADNSYRSLSADVFLQTPYEGAYVPPDGIFYIFWGASAAGTRFASIANDWGPAGSSGIFTATYDRGADQWTARNNANQTVPFAALATDVIFAIGYKTDATGGIRELTPLVAQIEGFDAPSALAGMVQKLDADGAATRILPVGVTTGEAFDGDTIVFSTPWPAPPTIMFGAGGRLTDPTLNNTQQQVFKAVNVSSAGFTASLKLREASSTPQSFSDGPGAGGGPGLVIEKSTNLQSKTDTYRYTYTAAGGGSGPGEPPSFLRVGFYTRTTAAGAWTKRDEVTIGPGTLRTWTRDITVDGLGIDAAFAIAVEDAENGFISEFVSVTYDTDDANEVTATPAGSSPVPFVLLGGSASL